MRSATLGLSSILLLHSVVFAFEEEELVGSWACEGSKGDVSFTTNWRLEADGRYVDRTQVATRGDLDSDGTLDDIRTVTVESGRWEKFSDGGIRAHVHELEIKSLVVNDVELSPDQAAEALRSMRENAIGRVVEVDVVELAATSLVVRISGVLSDCVRE